MIDLPQTDMQRVLAQGQDYLDVEVTRQDAERFAAVTDQELPQELSQYLRSSLYLDWQTASVKAAAQTVPCDSDKPWDIALGLWKYVDKTIFIKNLEVYFDPASKVLASHQGDCTEHAVLLAALARAKGLPSRLVVGLTQVRRRDGREVIFGYHAWTEVWIDGLWVSLDAALKQAPVDVSHIALGVSAANNPEPLGNVAAGMAQIIGNLEIELLRQD
jgi:transglutaminase-like putative cysteine protease